MNIIKGSTRWCFVLGDYAIKIPSLHSYTNFLNGLLANMNECKFSKCIDFSEKLCPVFFSIPFGFLVVMPLVRVLKKGELSNEYLINFCECNNGVLPAEIKHDSFGYLKGKLVCIDYG